MADMTPVDPTGINAAGKVALYWVPAIANISAPTSVELAAGINLSKIVTAWSPNGSQAKQERVRYGYSAVGTSLGLVKYEPAALEYDWDPQHPEATGEYKHVATLAAGSKGFLVDRRGLAPEVVPAKDHVVDIYPAELGVQMRVDVDPTKAGETLRVKQEIGVVGDVKLGVKIAS